MIPLLAADTDLPVWAQTLVQLGGLGGVLFWLIKYELPARAKERIDAIAADRVERAQRDDKFILALAVERTHNETAVAGTHERITELEKQSLETYGLIARTLLDRDGPRGAFRGGAGDVIDLPPLTDKPIGFTK